MNKFIKSTLILLFGGIITKIFSFIIRIYFTRVVGTDGIGIYSLVMPSFSLLVTITTLGFPLAISNIVAKGEKRGKTVVFSAIPIAMILNLFLILIMVFASKYISIYLLHNESTYYPLLALSFVLPFISVASILRGYFFGKQQMFPHAISNVIEQIFKLSIVLLVLPRIMHYGVVVTVTGYILISILSETMSIIIFLIFLPKKFNFSSKDLVPDFGTVKDVLTIGLPCTSSRLIGNIGYFFEPIILTNIMLKMGFSSSYITNQYGIYNTYVLGLLLVPTYLQMAIGTALLPEMSKNYQNKVKVFKIFKKVTLFSVLFGICANTFLYFFCDEILWIVFRTTEGANYIKFMCFFFIIYYFEAPINSTLQALSENNYMMKTTFWSTVVRLIVLALLSFLKFSMYALIISEIVNIIFVVIFNYKRLCKKLKN